MGSEAVVVVAVQESERGDKNPLNEQRVGSGGVSIGDHRPASVRGASEPDRATLSCAAPSAMLLTQLPADVLDRIIVCSHDLWGLWTTVRISRNIYDVFSTRKASIIQCVAKNMIAREPPQALDICTSSKGYRQAYVVARHAVTATALERIYGLRCAHPSCHRGSG